VSAPLRRAALLVLTLAPLATPIRAGAQVALEGRVVAGLDSVPVGPVQVELHRVDQEGGAVLDSVLSTADGRFRFSIDTAGAGPSLFLAAVRRQGVVYFGPPLHAGMQPEGPYRVVVFDTTTATGPVGGARVTLRHVVVSPVGPDGVEIAEIFDVTGTPDRTWVPGPDSVAVFRAPLPAGARGLERLEGGLPGRALRLDGGALEVRASLAPSGFRAAVAYLADGPDVVIPIEHPTDRLDVILVGAEAARLEGLAPADDPTMGAGSGARRYAASDLGPGDRVRVEIAVPGTPRDRALLWLGIALALLAAAALSAAFVRRADTT
jgi:hypothetical protein